MLTWRWILLARWRGGLARWWSGLARWWSFCTGWSGLLVGVWCSFLSCCFSNELSRLLLLSNFLDLWHPTRRGWGSRLSLLSLSLGEGFIVVLAHIAHYLSNLFVDSSDIFFLSSSGISKCSKLGFEKMSRLKVLSFF